MNHAGIENQLKQQKLICFLICYLCLTFSLTDDYTYIRLFALYMHFSLSQALILASIYFLSENGPYFDRKFELPK